MSRFMFSGVPRSSSVFRKSLATNQWSAIGTSLNALARSIAVSLDGNTVYAGGDFTQAGGVNANKIARWNGSSWSAMGAGLNNRVEIISIAPNGDVYAGGSFTNFSRIAKWNGTAWSALGTGVNSVVEEIQFVAAASGNCGFDLGAVCFGLGHDGSWCSEDSIRSGSAFKKASISRRWPCCVSN